MVGGSSLFSLKAQFKENLVCLDYTTKSGTNHSTIENLNRRTLALAARRLSNVGIGSPSLKLATLKLGNTPLDATPQTSVALNNRTSIAANHGVELARPM